MEVKGIFDGVVSILEKALDFCAVRQKVIAANIANADTPHYKSFDLILGQKLEGEFQRIDLKATQPGHLRNFIGMVQTHSNHFSGRKPLQSNPQYQFVPLPPLTISSDGNTVDIDRQMSKLAENTIMYNIYAQILSKKFRIIKEAIQEGGR